MLAATTTRHVEPDAVSTDLPVAEAYWRLRSADELPETQLLARGIGDDWLASAPPPPSDLPLPDPAAPGPWIRSAQEWLVAESERTAAALAPLPDSALSRALAQVLPTLATDGAWLQYASNPLNSHTPLASSMLRLYCHRRGTAGRLVAGLRVQLGFPDPGSWEFATHRDLQPQAFGPPILQLALAQQACVRLPELLGLTLFAAIATPDPLLEALARRLPALPAIPRVREDEVADVLLALEQAGVAADRTAVARLRSGFSAAAGLQRLTREAALRLARQDGPMARMVSLLTRKAAVAQGYHGAIGMPNGPLDALLGGSDPSAILDALAASDYVVPGDPDRSRLLAAASGPRGAMAGVFDASEIATIRAWIASLPDAIEPPSPGPPTLALPRIPAPGSVASNDRWAWDGRPLRELYNPLLHIDEHPELLPLARGLATLWLARAGVGQERPGPRGLPFARYDHAALEAWLHARHREQVAECRACASPDGAGAPSREAVIDDAVQLCPMVLIDGAWLHRTAQLGFAETPVGALLFRIWRDEVGDGAVRENHPNLHRELMQEMGIAMPAFGTAAFAGWSRLRDEAFAVPVFWLCIARFPRHFLPELLGLNLAMELSGVGGAYRRAAAALRAHGFTPTFVELHNTVDNISTGHTASAAAAIRLHLDEALALGGPEDVQRRWKRIWCGYRALVPPPGFER